MLRAIVLLFLIFTAITSAEQRVYLAAGNKVTVFKVDEVTGKLTQQQALDLPGAGPMTSSLDHKRIYIMAAMDKKPAQKRPPAAMATLKVADDGSIKIEHLALIKQRGGYLGLHPSGTWIAGNHYQSGMATIWKLEDGVYKGTTAHEVKLEKQSHSSVFSPDGKFLLVPATGPNKVFQLKFDGTTGKATPNTPPSAPGPAGDNDARQPRHLVFHPTLPVVYTTNEREQPGVGMWSWDATTGTLKFIQNLRSSPPGFKGSITTADLHVTPNGKFLYVSNRDGTKRADQSHQDTIAAYSLHAKTGRMLPLGFFSCEHIPRTMDLDADGKFLYVAGQRDDHLGAYQIDATGKLKKIGVYRVGSRPIWVHCMRLKP
jgi:6-phosphogluconolactonase